MELKVKDEKKTNGVLNFLKNNRGVIFLTVGLIVGYEIGQDVGYYKGRIFVQNEWLKTMQNK